MKIWIFIGFYSPPHTKRRLSFVNSYSHGKHDFHNFFSLLVVFRLFSFRILYSWHFVAHFSVHLVLAIFRPRDQRNDCHRITENRAVKVHTRAFALFHSLYMVQFQRYRQDKRKPVAQENPEFELKLWRKIAIFSQCQVPSDFCMCCKLLLSSLFARNPTLLSSSRQKLIFGSMHAAPKIKQLSE